MGDEDPLIGAMFGSRQLQALVGRGGMGRVYKALDVELDRFVAVKLVDAAGPAGKDAAASLAQVLAEARSAAKLADSRIVAIYDIGTERGIPYIVMQWVDGESLETRVKRGGPLSLAHALELVKETTSALSVAHAAGIVHRDVKPGNIIIEARGAIKLTDFGLARGVGAAAAEGEALTGSFHFMAPEQSRGDPPDPRSDLYALGATWYYALTAQPPYPGPAMNALLRHREEAVPEVRMLRPEVTEKAASLLRRLMAKSPEQRPPDAKALLVELSAVGMLLETDASGSPFKILPPAPRLDERAYPLMPMNGPPAAQAARPPQEPVFVEPLSAAVSPFSPPPPPPPAAVAELGSRASFLALLSFLGLAVFGWQWLRAGAEDWAAGAGVFAALPAALTIGTRWTLRRKALAVASALGAVFCWLHYVRAGASPAGPALEAMIFAGLGACALFGSVYLGQWGQDKSEAAWARALGLAAGACLLLSAWTWTAPETQPWLAALIERFAAWRSAFIASGGVWRWSGAIGLFFAMGAAVNLKTADADAPKDRKLNWNR